MGERTDALRQERDRHLAESGAIPVVPESNQQAPAHDRRSYMEPSQGPAPAVIPDPRPAVEAPASRQAPAQPAGRQPQAAPAWESQTLSDAQAGSAARPRPAAQHRNSAQPQAAVQAQVAAQPRPAVQPQAAVQPRPAVQPGGSSAADRDAHARQQRLNDGTTPRHATGTAAPSLRNRSERPARTATTASARQNSGAMPIVRERDAAAKTTTGPKPKPAVSQPAPAVERPASGAKPEAAAKQQPAAARPQGSTPQGKRAAGEPEANQPVVICDDVHVDFKTLATGRRLKAGQSGGLLQRGRSFKTVHALKGISFVARANESIGIIGSNGSGKSTLMRALTGLIPPTKGAIYAKSRPNLLGVGAALIPELSGGQNIILGGLAMGMSRDQIESKYDDVVEFSGLGEFIEMPMRTYSSGMTARLKFAIATAKDYEILIVDEALSVGDKAFQKRSEARIRGIRESAGTVFLVSHSMRSIRDTCNRSIWIEKGDLRADGPTADVVKEYEKHK